MASAQPPRFDPSRQPPASNDGTTPASRAPILPIDKAHKWLGDAWTAFDRARHDARNPAPDRLRCREPACTEHCPVCTLRCSIAVSCLRGAYRDYQDALAAAGPVLSFDGAIYATMGGRA